MLVFLISSIHVQSSFFSSFSFFIYYSSSCSATTLATTRCQALLLIPRKFHIPKFESGCTLYPASTALHITVTSELVKLSGIATSTSQMVQAHARSRGWSEPSFSVAMCQVLPLSMLTSTRMMALPPPE